MTVDTAIEILTDRRTCMECVMGNGSCEDCDHAFDMAIKSLAERKTMTHEEAVGFLQASGWLQDHDRQIYEQGKRDGIEERKTGRWIAQKISNSWSDYKCSECGRILTVLYSFGDIPTVSDVVNDYPFCHCGAKMKGVGEYAEQL